MSDDTELARLRAMFSDYQATSAGKSRLEREYLIFGEQWAEQLAIQRLVADHHRKRTWRERLLSWPWRPWRAWVTVAQWAPEAITLLRARAAKAFPNRILVDPMTMDIEEIAP